MNPPCIIDDPIINMSPPNCIIDARRPYPPHMPFQRQGFSSWTWVFQNPLGTGEDASSDFEITQIPCDVPPDPPTISSVTWEAGNTVTIHLSEPVRPNRWTCLRHIASNKRRCVGYLPGDANSNRTTLTNDILDIIDNLNGLRHPPLQIHQCDIDRSGVCAPADILSEIDLMNGASGFPNQNGDTLPPCPSFTP